MQHESRHSLATCSVQALSLAEQLGGGGSQTPQVGVVLGLLGNVYARSKRITLAEGLHRRARTASCLHHASTK